MTNLARYFILGIISFLFSLNFPVLAGTNIAGMGNLARAQSGYYENTFSPSVFAYLAGGLLILASFGTIIYMVFFMKLEKDNVES
jgi:hypothetical protein